MKAEYVSHHGTDLSVVNAAYASFAKTANAWEPKHERLIAYLARGVTQEEYNQLLGLTAEEILNKKIHQHWSPFAHVHISIKLRAPIAIHAQHLKHLAGFNNSSKSFRYTSSNPEYFQPSFREAPSGNIKQGSGGEHPKNKELLELYNSACQHCIETYEELLKQGVAPEQCRFVLPQGVYTEWVSTGSLAAWARLYNQRTDSHAQKEIQELARMCGEIIQPLFPVSWKYLT